MCVLLSAYICVSAHTCAYMYLWRPTLCVILQALTILLLEIGSLAGTLGSLINLCWLDPPVSTTLELGLQACATKPGVFKNCFCIVCRCV